MELSEEKVCQGNFKDWIVTNTKCDAYFLLSLLEKVRRLYSDLRGSDPRQDGIPPLFFSPHISLLTSHRHFFIQTESPPLPDSDPDHLKDTTQRSFEGKRKVITGLSFGEDPSKISGNDHHSIPPRSLCRFVNHLQTIKRAPSLPIFLHTRKYFKRLSSADYESVELLF